MDDDMEDELIHEILIAHLQMFWKYISLLSRNASRFVMMGSCGKAYNEMVQPTSLVIGSLMIVIFTILIHVKYDWMQKGSAIIRRSVKLSIPFIDNSLRNIISFSIGIDDCIFQDYKEGIVGASAVRGRRNAMEDRFSTLLNTEVQNGKKISLFGVYDGHGGQFVADYIKENLLPNIVQKIRTADEDKISSKKEKKINEKNFSKPKKSSVFVSNSDVSSNGAEILINNTTPDNKCNLITGESNSSTSQESKSGYEETNVDTVDTTSQATIELISSSFSKIEDIDVENEAQSIPQSSQAEATEKSELEDLPPIKSMKDDAYESVKHIKKSNLSKRESGREKDMPKTSDFSAKRYMDKQFNINYAKLLTDQILEIDEKVIEYCRNKADLSGTTAVIAILDGDHLVVGNVGDSRAVLGDTKGGAIPLSFDHKPNQLKESRRITEAGGFVTFAGVWRVVGVLATSRAIGDFILKRPKALVIAEPDVLTFNIKDHKAHFIILATDGLWDVCTNEEAVEFIAEHINEKDFGARALTQHAYDKGSQDNVTVMVVNLKI